MPHRSIKVQSSTGRSEVLGEEEAITGFIGFWNDKVPLIYLLHFFHWPGSRRQADSLEIMETRQIACVCIKEQSLFRKPFTVIFLFLSLFLVFPQDRQKITRAWRSGTVIIFSSIKNSPLNVKFQYKRKSDAFRVVQFVRCWAEFTSMLSSIFVTHKLNYTRSKK